MGQKCGDECREYYDEYGEYCDECGDECEEYYDEYGEYCDECGNINVGIINIFFMFQGICC
jgi:hypothetical protein